MHKLGRLLRPAGVGAWIWLILILGMTFMEFAFTFTGQTDYEVLRDRGVHTTLPIVEVASRDDAGNPTEVVVPLSSGRSSTRILKQAEGSVVDNKVRVVMAGGAGAYGDIVWTETEFARTNPTSQTLRVLLGGLLVAIGPVAVANLWRELRTTTVPSAWSDTAVRERARAADASAGREPAQPEPAPPPTPARERRDDRSGWEPPTR